MSKTESPISLNNHELAILLESLNCLNSIEVKHIERQYGSVYALRSRLSELAQQLPNPSPSYDFSSSY